MELQSVQIVDASATTMLFEEKQIAKNFITMNSAAIASSELRSATRMFYLLENC